jgi:F-type H+-transporting ATPase subunit b
MSKYIRIYLLLAGVVLAGSLLFAQSSSIQSGTGQSGNQTQPAASVTTAKPADLDRAAETALGKASVQAGEGHPPENEEEMEENAQFKYSPLVKRVANSTGLSKETIYWIFLITNFLILALALRWVLKKVLPNGFAPRTAEIKKGIEDARKASADASARLGEIETRLAKLDAEIAEIRTAAEADFSVEETRIKAAAQQDAANVIAAAEQEIAAATRTAQRELKSFVADLAVGLAEKKIKVDDATDMALVRGFAAQLGKDGR